MKKYIIDRIKEKEAVIGIIGVGYVGLPLAMKFAEKGFEVVGFDIDDKKVAMLNLGKNYIKHINLEEFPFKENISATRDMSYLSSVDVILICVPTPLNKNREPNLSYVVNSTKEIAKFMRKGQLISLESTTYPGTTDQVMLNILMDKNVHSGQYNVGEDYFLVYSPEREDPGNKNFNVETTPKVLGGVTNSCLEVGEYLYKSIVKDVVSVSSTRVAEMTKILENTYRAVNIALVNELKIICDRMDINIFEVIEAAKTKPFGFQAFYPGPGLGGHCIPIDPFYLSWKAREYDINTKLIELSGEINTNMPFYVVGKITEALNTNKKSLLDSFLLILGAAYKADIDDDRESPAFKIIDILNTQGANILYHDPYISDLKGGRHFPHINMSSIPNKILESTIKNKTIDCVILITDHSMYKTQEFRKLVEENAKLIVDTRNVFDNKNIKVFGA